MATLAYPVLVFDGKNRWVHIGGGVYALEYAQSGVEKRYEEIVR